MLVSSFYAYRHDQWGIDYVPLLHLLTASCRRFDLQHIVIGDKPLPGLDVMLCDLPENLMLAILEGQKQLLEWTREPVLLVGADCLITKDPRDVLQGDMTITIGPFTDCEMNTGAIWCADGALCAPVWQDALDRRPAAWGDDQRALYGAIQESGLDVRQVRCEAENWAPNDVTDDAGMPTVVHFRGNRKAWMADWARRHMGLKL